MVVDGAVLDVSTFARRHPGGARLIRNALGTDVTEELLGADGSVGRARFTAFSPHTHTEVLNKLASENISECQVHLRALSKSARLVYELHFRGSHEFLSTVFLFVVDVARV